MANNKHVLAYIGIVVFVTWLGNGVIPEIQAGHVPIPDSLAWLVRSLVPGLVMLCALLPSVVGRPTGFPDVPTTTVTVTPPALMTNASGQDLAKAVTDALTATARPVAPPLPGAPALAPSVPSPVIPDPVPPVDPPKAG